MVDVIDAGPLRTYRTRQTSDAARGAVLGAITEKLADGSLYGLLFDVKRFALHDGPGIRTTAFLKGCPLSCAWCHNPESQSAAPELMVWAERCVSCAACVAACPVGAISMSGGGAQTDRDLCTACGACVLACPADARAIAGATWSVKQLLDVIEKDLLFYDESDGGVTLSGGEPLAQSAFAASLLAACQARRIHTAVDTCGFAEWRDLDRVAQETDLFLFDVKMIDEARHRKLTGVSNELIFENLRRLSEEGKRLWIRYPVIPGVNDAQRDIVALGRLVRGLRSVEAVHLLPFHRGGERKCDRLGRTDRWVAKEREPRISAEAAAKVLRGIVGIPVHVGG